jgi:hypothetical protein
MESNTFFLTSSRARRDTDLYQLTPHFAIYSFFELLEVYIRIPKDWSAFDAKYS